MSLCEDRPPSQAPVTRNRLRWGQAPGARDIYRFLRYRTGASIPVRLGSVRGKCEKRHCADPLPQSLPVLHIDTGDSMAFEALPCN